MDSCIEAFGTTKQKRALNSRRMNKVGSESLNHAVAKAAENIIDTKGVTGKQLELGVRIQSQRQPSLEIFYPSHKWKWWELGLDSFLLLSEGLCRNRLWK